MVGSLSGGAVPAGVAEAVKVLQAVWEGFGQGFFLRQGLVGGVGITALDRAPNREALDQYEQDAIVSVVGEGHKTYDITEEGKTKMRKLIAQEVRSC